MTRAADPSFPVGVASLSRRFGSLCALDRVSFTVRRGEILGLIGPNGAGKTTLFECLAGLQPADEGGLVTATGRALTSVERAALLYFVPDGIRPWADQRVGWALDFAAGFFGGDPERRADVMKSLDLGALCETRVGALSKGQAKRVLLAIGLLTPQPLLLCDEPFDGLDLRQTRAVAEVLRAHASGGRTLFLSIHQIGDAARVCDRFVLLSAGRVCGEGTARELAATAPGAGPQLDEIFLALT